MHWMPEAGIRVVVHVVSQHGPDLSGVLVGDGDEYFAKWHAVIQLSVSTAVLA
jgi:hypothetical protein